MKKYLFLILCSLFLVSCESNRLDGDWDAMEWKIGNNKLKNHSIEVPKNGGTYVLTCKNYNGFWLCSVVEDDDAIEFGNSLHNAKGNWSSVDIQNNLMTIIISSNKSDQNRSLDIEVTAGDTFAPFHFIQLGNDNE